VICYPYPPTDVDRYMHQVAAEMDRRKTFNQAPVGVYFGRPGAPARMRRTLNYQPLREPATAGEVLPLRTESRPANGRRREENAGIPHLSE